MLADQIVIHRMVQVSIYKKENFTRIFATNELNQLTVSHSRKMQNPMIFNFECQIIRQKHRITIDFCIWVRVSQKAEDLILDLGLIRFIQGNLGI